MRIFSGRRSWRNSTGDKGVLGPTDMCFNRDAYGMARVVGIRRVILHLVAMALLICAGCGGDSAETVELRVLMADSLSRSFRAVAEAFEKQHPEVTLQLNPSGSVLAARKIVEANDRADVLAVADYLVIDKLLRPDHADWYICFATNEIGIAYSDASQGAAELTADNWYEVLSRDGVKVAAANPLHDPCGYWTELCWQLADLHYGTDGRIVAAMTAKCGEAETRRGDSQQLMQLVEVAGGIDYVFCYRSQARQHHAPFLRLPPEISLGSPEHVSWYRQVSIELPGKEPGASFEKQGEAIVFAVTIPKNARQSEWAARFVAFLLSDEGRRIMEKHYVTMLAEPYTFDAAAVPSSLREGLSAKPRSASSTSPSHEDQDG